LKCTFSLRWQEVSGCSVCSARAPATASVGFDVRLQSQTRASRPGSASMTVRACEQADRIAKFSVSATARARRTLCRSTGKQARARRVRSVCVQPSCPGGARTSMATFAPVTFFLCLSPPPPPPPDAMREGLMMSRPEQRCQSDRGRSGVSKRALDPSNPRSTHPGSHELGEDGRRLCKEGTRGQRWMGGRKER
jgi:hypothetical protein